MGPDGSADRAARSVPDSQRISPSASHASAGWLFRRASSGYAARTRHARGPRQRTCGGASASMCSAPRSMASPSARVLGGWRRSFRRRLCLCQSDQFLVRRVDCLPDDVAAGRLASPIGSAIWYWPADPDSGMAAIPEKRPRLYLAIYRIVRHPHHPLHARWIWGSHHVATQRWRRKGEGACRGPGAAIGSADGWPVPSWLEVKGSRNISAAQAVDDVDIDDQAWRRSRVIGRTAPARPQS